MATSFRLFRELADCSTFPKRENTTHVLAEYCRLVRVLHQLVVECLQRSSRTRCLLDSPPVVRGKPRSVLSPIATAMMRTRRYLRALVGSWRVKDIFKVLLYKESFITIFSQLSIMINRTELSVLGLFRIDELFLLCSV